MTTETPLSLGFLLRQHRMARELTQEELAERAGVSPRAISDIERGGPHVPRRDTVALLAQALALTAEERTAFMAAAHSLQQAVFAARPAARPLLIGVPVPLTLLIGREREEAIIVDLLQGGQVRLLTLTGPGGVGKTRLAQRVATTLAATFADGAVYVSLAALHDPHLVASAIATALEVSETGIRGLPAQLVAALQEKKMLLVLDNFEQVEAAAPLVTTLLSACPALCVLVTSRHLLHLQGEHEFAVPPLGLPDQRRPATADAIADCAAVALFIQRARAVAPEFALTEETASAVAEICARLDGLPLALELAAARLRLLSPQALLERLGTRLTVLAGGARDLPTRQQTLRHTMAWSFELLSPDEQVLFRRLAVFAGGWTLEAAERVCWSGGGSLRLGVTVLEGLASLVDKSLVQRAPAVHGEPRFSLLETIGEFAAEQLAAAPAGEEATLRRAHAAYYLALAEKAAAAGGYVSHWAWLGLGFAGHRGWQERLVQEQDNLRAALRWAQVNADLDVGLRLAGALGWFWYVEGYWSEGRAWLATFQQIEQERARTGVTPALAPQLTRYLDAAGFARMQGDYQHATSLLTENLALLRRREDRRGVAVVLACLGLMEELPARAVELYEESLDLCRDLGDSEGSAFLLTRLADLAFLQHDAPRSLVLQAEAGAVAQAQGDPRLIAAMLLEQGRLTARHGDLRVARALLEETVVLVRAPHHEARLTDVRVSCAAVARAQGDYAAARSLLEETLTRLHAARGNQPYLAVTLLNLGLTAREQGDLAGAAAYTAESLHLATVLDDTEFRGLALENQALIAWEQGDLDRADALCGEALACCRAVRTAYFDPVMQVLASLGLIARSQGELGRAQTCLTEALLRPRAMLIPLHTLVCLDGLAGLSALGGHHEHAVRLFGATTALRAALGGAVPPVLRTLYDSDIDAARTALGRAAFTAAWTAGAALSLEEAGTYALHTPAVG